MEIPSRPGSYFATLRERKFDEFSREDAKGIEGAKLSATICKALL